MRSKLFILIIGLFLFSCSEGDVDAADLIACGDFNPATHFCDRRDGNLYRFVRMPGGRDWMAENLRYEMPENRSKCYNDEQKNCLDYGRLYTWDDRIGLCPSGWEIPDMARDWEPLGAEVADDHLKSASGWSSYSIDPYRFSALPGGAYFVKYMGEDFDLFDGADAQKCTEIAPGEWSSWGNTLGQIAVFMAFSDQRKWFVADKQKLNFCVAANAYVSVRCVKM